MRLSPLALAVVFTLALAPAFADEPAGPRPKKLIEFGWDEPDTAFLRSHFAEMAKTPFDGCVFHVNTRKGENFTWLCWGDRTFEQDELQTALDDLKALPQGDFRHHFLRFNTAPGRLDWFDDFTAVTRNAALAARIAKEGRCAGILFDDEEYEGPLFDYAKQRDAKTKSWEQYAAQARKRGAEVMRAFQSDFPDLTILLTFGHTLPWMRSEGGKRPLAETSYGLLAPFLDGMIDAAEGRSRLIDGYEISYSYKNAAQFDEGLRFMTKDALTVVGDREKYRRVVAPGFGIWLDYDWRSKGWSDQDPSRNHFTPEGFETSVREALKRTDEIVWIYTETPRWWSPMGGSIKLPAAYDAALRRARGSRESASPK